MTDLWKLPAAEQSALLARGEVTSRQLVEAHLARIAAADGSIRAFTDVFRQGALAKADERDVERRAKRARGPLHGVPVSIKECLDIEGLVTTLGVESRRDAMATSTAAIVRALDDAGAVILGRTNVSQTMLFVECRNPIFGQTANPFSLAHTPGGSSGGEAAAIAAGMSPLGVGTDIGGSIRVPAHFSGVCGLKPTLDRLPMLGSQTFLGGQEAVRAQLGPMARTTACLSLFMRALDPRALSRLDPRTPPIDNEDPAAIDVARLRVGYYEDDGVLEASAACTRAVREAVEALRSRGCKVVAFQPTRAPDVVFDFLAGVSADGGRLIARALEGGKVDPVLKPLLALASLPAVGRLALARVAGLAGEKRIARMLSVLGEKDVVAFWGVVKALRAHRASFVTDLDDAGVDVLVCPPFATPALPHGMAKNFTLGGSYAMLFNALQLPAGVVPVTRVRPSETTRVVAKDAVQKLASKVDAKSAGLPVGVQVVARPWAEATVLATMQAIEEGVRGGAEFPRTPL